MAEHRHVELNLKPTEYEALRKTGLLFGNRVEAAPDARALRIFVRDSSGALGSVTIPLNAVWTGAAVP